MKRVGKLNAGIAKEMIVLLFTQDLKFVKTVVGKMVMFWDIMIIKIMIDYIFERRVFIRESIIMRKRLIK